MKKPNKLLLGLILISIGIHFIFYLQISGLLNSRVFSYIELIMTDVSKPETRSIPRPRPKTPEVLQEVKRIRVIQPAMPVKQIKIDPANYYSEGLMEGISVPAVDPCLTGGVGNYRITDYLGNDVEFGSQKDYMEMVTLRIESVKKYPEQARAMQKEGRVTVQFIIGLSGIVKDILIIEPCRHDLLNKAALQAVREASPFPKPPRRFFDRDVPLQLKIIFETT
ncbi:MAG: energy transducer TonB [Desulfobacteraceae bacterium]